MRLKGKIFWTLMIQALGSLATVLLSVTVAHRYGPTGVGYLSYFRSLVDVFSTFGAIGLPQAFIFLLNTNEVTLSGALRFRNRYSILCLLIGLVLAAVLVCNTTVRSLWALGPVPSFVVVVTAAILVFHSLSRALSLAKRPTLIFNLVSIAPAVFTLFIYVGWGPADFQKLVFGNMAAAALAGLFCYWIFRGEAGEPAHTKNSFETKKLFSYGLWSFVPALALTIIPAATYGLLRYRDPSGIVAGNFSVSVLFYSGLVLPLNMAIPILFNAWAGSNRNSALESHAIFSETMTLVSVVVIIPVGFVLIPWATAVLFGDRFATSVVSTQILLLAIPALCHERLLSALLLALDRPRIIAIAAAIKAIIALSLLTLVGMRLPLIVAAGLAWAVAEASAILFEAVIVKKATGVSLSVVLGVWPRRLLGRVVMWSSKSGRSV